MRSTVFLFLLLFISFILGWCSISIGDDYFSRITMVSDGRITRFSHTPITVYLASPPIPEELKHAYIGDVEYAMEQWSKCSEGQLYFSQIGSEDADIRLYWVKEPLSGEADPLGEASLVRSDSGGFYVKISIMLQERPSLKVELHRNLKAILMHEFGHAIGLWGHSWDSNDIMYRQSTAIYPTRRDKNTLLMLLSTTPDSPSHESAIAELKSDISRASNIAYLHFWLGTVYADKGEDDLAIKELLIALKLSPDLVTAANRLGRIFQKVGIYSKAIAYYSREAELEPSPGLYSVIGILYLRQEKYDKAIEYFRKALSIDSNFLAAKTDTLAAYHLWASRLIKERKLQQAISTLSIALELFPESRVLHYDMGIAYDSSGQYDKAIKQYKKALELDPSFVAAKGNIASCINNLGAEQIRNKNWQNSIELCEQSLKWDPGFWEARKNLELAMLGLGREKHESGLLDEAVMNYKAVLDINPDNLDARTSLGFVFYEKGMYEDAMSCFKAALSADPNSQDARMGIDIVKRRINVNRAKLAFILTSVSMVICASIISISRYRCRGKMRAV